MPRKSRVVGPATDSDGMRTTAYRALEALACAHCGGAIAPDALFSRRARRTPVRAMGATGITGGTTTEPLCIACRPLRLDSAGSGDAD
jgi:hypothetical protein